VVRGSVEILGRSYTIRLEMLDGATGSLLEVREDRCDICTEDEAYETAGVTASALKAKVFKRRASLMAAPAPPGEAAGAPAPQATLALPPTPSAEPAPQRSRTLGWVSLGAGALAVAAGVVLLSMHHDGTCQGGKNCMERLNTQLGGITLTALGGVALLTGGVVLFGGP
jgi:hypothetical protein